MTIRHTSRWLFALLLTLVATTATAQDGDTPTAPPAPEERIVTLFQDLSSQLKSAGDDCAKAAAAVTTWTSTNAEEMRTLSKSLEQREQELDEARLKALEEELAPAMEALIGTAIQCAEDAPFQAAIDGMDKAMNGEQQ